MKFIKNIITLLVFSLALQSTAQEAFVEAALDTNVILIGDQVDFKIKLQIPESGSFMWPTLADTLPEKIEIVGKSAIDTIALGNGYLTIEQTLSLTAFDSGYYLIKPLQFRYGNNLENTLQTEPYLLNVFTVEVDTALAIKPIKGPMAAPLTFAEILPWALGSLVFILIAAGLIYFLIKQKKNQPIILKKSKPKLPAHRIAFDELEKLKLEKLWQRGHEKAYHSRLTDILRTYIEDRYKIAALEMTTWETIRAFSGAKIEKNNLEMLRVILELADLTKFAKFKPLPDENEKTIVDAERFVKQTMNSNETPNNIKNNEITNSNTELAGV